MSKKIQYNTQVGVANPENQSYWSNVGNRAVDEFNQNTGSMVDEMLAGGWGRTPTSKEMVDAAMQTPGYTEASVPLDVIQGKSNVGMGAFVTPGPEAVPEQGAPNVPAKDITVGGYDDWDQKNYNRWQRAIDRAGKGKAILDPRYRRELINQGHARPRLKDYKLGSGDWIKAMQDWRSIQLENPEVTKRTAWQNEPAQLRAQQSIANRRAENPVTSIKDDTVTSWDDVIMDAGEDKGKTSAPLAASGPESYFNQDYSSAGSDYLQKELIRGMEEEELQNKQTSNVGVNGIY